MRSRWNKWMMIIVLSVPFSAIAQNLVVNGDFESGSTGWNEWWGGNSDIGDHTADYGDNPSVNNDAGIWWTDDAFYQDIAIGADEYTLSVDMINASAYPLTGGREAVLLAGISNASGTVQWQQEITIGSDSPLNTWVNGSTVIDNRTAGASNVRITLLLRGSNSGNAYFDNVSMVGSAQQSDISFTHVPPYGTYEDLTGQVSGVVYDDYKVLVYIYVGGWWNKPSWSSPLTSINLDGTWTCDITTGGISDTLATQIIAFLIPNGAYQDSAWRMSGQTDLPAELYTYPYEEITRTPVNRTIQFAGHNWEVKSGYNGPGPNNFSDSENNVWVDENGHLHLKITYLGGQWYCSEVISYESFGYGTYVYTVDSRVDLLDQNIVLGLFTWDTYAPEYNYREIDFEFSRWKNPANDIGQYVIQPWQPQENMFRFDIDYAGQGNTTTHVMTWRPNPEGIYFKSYYGGFSLAPPPGDMIVDWRYTGSDNPPAGGENARMNLWLIEGLAPNNEQEAEIVISDFQFLSGISDQPADINDDDSVNLGDFSKVAAGWQNTGCGADNTWCEEADLTCDGVVDADDVLAFIDYWMETLN